MACWYCLWNLQDRKNDVIHFDIRTMDIRVLIWSYAMNFEKFIIYNIIADSLQCSCLANSVCTKDRPCHLKMLDMFISY
jgi:hypothetical protein